MKRAAILIGVDKTGDLPRLRDGARGARLMEGWARTQGIDPVVITDESVPVTVDRIKQAIRKLVDAGTIGQLLVYFAGHGVNLQRQEYWLLTEAPDDTQAAVNVATSSALAATCGIPHVVLISDACRTAPEGIRAQSIRGSEIFPNREEDTKPVDQFFACQLGKPSHEIRDPAVTSSEFKALYTNELVPALLGQHSEIVTWTMGDANKLGHIHLRPLRDYLASAVAARLVGLQMQTKVIQVPVAQLSSDPPAWLAQFDAQAMEEPRRGPAPPPQEPPAIVTPVSVTAALVRQAIDGGGNVSLEPPGLDSVVAATRQTLRVAASLTSEAQRVAQPFGPTHHETRSGFKVRGAQVVDVEARVSIGFAGAHAAQGDDLRVDPKRPASYVLLVLENGAGVLLPAIPDFLCALTFAEGELVDVAYEPSDNTWRWSEFQQRAPEIRALRGIASAAMARGVFKLERDDAFAIARRMQFSKAVDPSLSLYAAYAYRDLQRPELIREMTRFMRDDLGAVLFDVALLARVLDKTKSGQDAPPLIGAVPLMAQGWPFLRAFEVTLPAALAALEDYRLPSLWTMFNANGVRIIRQAFANGNLT